MFDIFGYAKDNEVSVEVYPVADPDGYMVRLRDFKTAATESTLIRESDLRGLAKPGAYIESRCDQLITMIGKRKAEHDRRKKESVRRNAIWDFFRSSGTGIMEQ